MTRSLATSSDGQWAVYRNDRALFAYAAGSPPAVGQLTLTADDVDVAVIGPPTAVAVVSRLATGGAVDLHQPPYLDAAAHLDLEVPMRLAAITGPRIALVSLDNKRVEVVRAAARSLATQTLDVGSPVEFVVGLERNQLLFGLLRKLEVWDAVLGRPLLRLQLQLPPPPRSVGSAAGHLWVTRPGSDEVFLYRLSDGRPFRHYVGAPIDNVISHPGSPVIVLVTQRGLVRLHCFAHSLTVVDVPAQLITDGAALAQLVVGDDVSLIGVHAHADAVPHAGDPWHLAIGGAGAPTTPAEPADSDDVASPNAADRLRAMRDRNDARATPEASLLRSGGGAVASRASSMSTAATSTTSASGAGGNRWREPLAAYATELVRGVDADLPVVPIETELGALAHRLGLPATARRALIALYGLHLVGEPALPIARLSRLLGGDWSEALGTGELGELAMLRRHGGKVALRRTVTDLLDGHAPRAVRVVGTDQPAPRAGVSKRARGGRTDATIESDLIAELGRIAITAGRDGRLSSAVLEARLRGATAIALAEPAALPQPWPRDAALVIITDDAPSPA